jgi:hypothetical protein
MVTVKGLQEKITYLRGKIGEMTEQHTDFMIGIAHLLGQEIAKIHILKAENIHTRILLDGKIVYTHADNELFRLEFKEFNEIIGYLVAMCKLERDHMKINLVEVDEGKIITKETDILDFQENLRKRLGESK